jgi:hypothetical protein
MFLALFFSVAALARASMGSRPISIFPHLIFCHVSPPKEEPAAVIFFKSLSVSLRLTASTGFF